MDLLSGESAPFLTTIKRQFRSLNLIDINYDDILSKALYDVNYGHLSNGLTYYVRSSSNPKMRAALALVVKVGSVLEEEDERGAAHIVEHLAVTKNFGAYQNAATSADDTVYELFVSLDKPEILSWSISVLAEITNGLRVSVNDLENEKGVVLEEYKHHRNAYGRIHDAKKVLMMKGSKYAERIPFGTEKMSELTPEIVKGFYNKWYHMQNMALIVVGDFLNTQDVVKLIKTHFEVITPTLHPPLIPQLTVPSHEQPHFSNLVESEANGSSVMVGWNVPVVGLETVKDYRNFLVESMFFLALNQRFVKLSYKNNSPYFSCSAEVDVLVRPIKAYIISSCCKKNETIGALESMLIEVARVRMHGFSEHEISAARARLLSEIESAYIERDQIQSSNLRDEYVQHFLRNEPVLEIEYEAQLHKTLLPDISASEVSKHSENFRTSFSCAIKTIEPQAAATEDDLRNVVSRVNILEKERSISPWDHEKIPEEIVSINPEPGDVVQQLEYFYIGANEMIMSNGMRVCYKCTNFSDDQVLFTGFSYGGLSELEECDYISCSMSPTIAGEIGEFGYRPSVLSDMLAGKRAKVGTSLTSHMRSFSGDCSPSDLETALQLVYQLFMTDLKPEAKVVEKVMQMAEESILAKERDPYTAFDNRVKEINYGDSYFFRSIKIGDIRNVDHIRACEYFNKCFKDPSTFTVVMVGNIDPTIACPLILRYLGGIPRPPRPIMNLKHDELKDLPFTFPSTVIRDIVRRPMVQAECLVQLCFPVELKHENVMRDLHLTGLISKLLEIRMLQVLRFKHGHIYSAGVSVFLSGNKHSRTSNIRGDISINFSCDSEISSTLVINLALDEILRLQKEGPLDVEVSAILEVEQMDNENGLEDNNYWLERIVDSYQAGIYSGDVDDSFEIQDKGRISLRNSLMPLTVQLALQRIIPFPCKKQYTVIILTPQQSSHFKELKSIFGSKEAKILVGVAGLALLALGLGISQTK